MARTIQNDVQTQLESRGRSGVILAFLTVTAPNQVEPARIVCEESGNASIHRGKFLSYVLDGETFVGLPWKPARLSDNDDVSRATVSIPQYDRRIAEWFMTMEDIATMKIEYYPSWAWGAPDNDALRLPIGTPVAVYDADYLFVRRASGNSQEVVCDISGYDFSQEPWGFRASQLLTPDLYR